MQNKPKLLDILRNKIRLKHYSLKAEKSYIAWNKSHIPVVLTVEEVKVVLFNSSGTYKLMLSLLYGCGLRMNELLRLRIKDIDFGFDKIYIWDSKTQSDRVVPLPLKLKQDLELQARQVKDTHKQDLGAGFGYVNLPFALQKKYQNANREFKWQYLFPMKNISKDPRTDKNIRFHVLEKTFGRNIKTAVN